MTMSEPAAIDVEIGRVKAAVRRAEESLYALSLSARGHCCPTCFHGRGYTGPADAQERRLAWLRVLLRKRDGAGDGDLARAIEMSAWP
jgi:hypothetical protein